MSCPQIWNTVREKEKGKVGEMPAKLNEKKSDRQLQGEIKDHGDIFLLEEQRENFVTAVEKIRNASGHHGDSLRASSPVWASEVARSLK